MACILCIALSIILGVGILVLLYLIYLGLFYKIKVVKDKFGPVHIIATDFVGKYWNIGPAFVNIFKFLTIYFLLILSE